MSTCSRSTVAATAAPTITPSTATINATAATSATGITIPIATIAVARSTIVSAIASIDAVIDAFPAADGSR